MVTNIKDIQHKSLDLSRAVRQAIEQDSVQSIFALAPHFARLSVSEYAVYKAELKAHFKRRLPLADLEAIIREARKRIRRKQIRQQSESAHPIIMTGGQMRDMKEAALQALVQYNEPEPHIFVQSGRLVTIHFDERNVPFLTEVTEDRLRSFMSNSADYFAIRETSDDVKKTPIFPPMDLVRSILNGTNARDYPFPPLAGITELPIVRDDGSIHQKPGYDPISMYVYIPGDLIVPDVPLSPTAQDVQEALAKLQYWIADFPFVDDASRAAILAMAITVVIRLAIRGQVPLCLMDAPKQGTGKSLVPMAIGILATGKPAVPQPPTRDDDEMRKRILTWLMQSPAVVLIDNINFVLESMSLNTALTTPTFGDRLLATNTNISVDNRAIWFATGNNLRTGDDTARRCIKCRMDAKMELPQMRDIEKFHIPGGVDGFFDWTRENRASLVAACLTLFRYWHAQGRKKPDVKPIGSFEAWTIILGGILQTAGVPGFLDNLYEDGESSIDDVSRQWKAFIAEINFAFSDRPFTTSELARLMLEDTLQAERLIEVLPGNFADSFESYQRSKGKSINFPTHLGTVFNTRRDVIYGHLRLQKSKQKDRSNRALWEIVSIVEEKLEQKEETPQPMDSTQIDEVTIGTVEDDPLYQEATTLLNQLPQEQTFECDGEILDLMAFHQRIKEALTLASQGAAAGAGRQWVQAIVSDLLTFTQQLSTSSEAERTPQ